MDQVQTLPRGAINPVPTGRLHSALQFVPVRLQHLEQRPLAQHRQEPALKRGLEPRPVRRVIDEPRQPVLGLGTERHRRDAATPDRSSVRLDLLPASFSRGRQRRGEALPIGHQPRPELARRQPIDRHPHPPGLWKRSYAYAGIRHVRA